MKHNEEDANHLYLTLNDPTLANLGELLNIAERHDQKHRDKYPGSVGKLFSHGLNTCLITAGVIVQALLAVIVLPIAWAIDQCLNSQSAISYLGWMVLCGQLILESARLTEREYTKLTYDEKTQCASTLHSFFSQSPIRESSENIEESALVLSK